MEFSHFNSHFLWLIIIFKSYLCHIIHRKNRNRSQLKLITSCPTITTHFVFTVSYSLHSSSSSSQLPGSFSLSHSVVDSGMPFLNTHIELSFIYIFSLKLIFNELNFIQFEYPNWNCYDLQPLFIFLFSLSYESLDFLPFIH